MPVEPLRELGYSDIYVWVFEDNIRARSFYERYGFIFDGTKAEVNYGKPLVGVRYLLSKAV